MSTEQDPIGAARSAAEGAPEPAEFGETLARRRDRGPRHRVRVRAALAVTGIVAVAFGVTAVVRAAQRTDVAGPGAASATPGAPERAADDAARQGEGARTVWPGAVASMPKKSADGFSYRPVTALGPTEILLTAEPSLERPERLEVYDTKTGRSRVLTTMAPGGEGYIAQNAEVGEDFIVWYGRKPSIPERWADFWVVPRQGGDPIRVGEVTGDLAEIDRFGVTGDHVVWSVRIGGVYRMPIGGGEAEKIPGTDGLWLASWPWARNVPAESDIETGQVAANQDLLVDLRTGARRTITPPPGTTGLRCSSEWCVGRQGGEAVAMRVDGSDRRRVPWHMTQPEIYGDRFVEVYRDTTSMIYDLVTGKAGGITAVSPDGRSGSYGQGTSSSPTQVFFWNAAGIEVKRTCAPAAGEQRKGRPELSPSPAPQATGCRTRTVEPGDDYDVLNLAAMPKEG
ncbi:hypothetical protein IMZ11_23020 [Microtetraspora sp. AC03309]|uniref:hypothetical protein n=1 Tax=Microtetraspora sp. AC03309 TaxID=2779376 RepID=UPI001E29613A|nr:hypothetical protein [Microtetraspora sp. AC03309]MCC5578503.1 hypothetical protein [Microtetraspora sp. AC03309]